jgi:uncharacterized Fe-S cluster-containing radical SAM superfamily protein
MPRSLTLMDILLLSFRARFLTFVFVFVQVKFKKYLTLTAVIDTNYGKTTRILNIPKTGTLLKHGTDRNENFGNKQHFILKTAIKSFESHRFVWVGWLTANKQHFNLGIKCGFHLSNTFYKVWISTQIICGSFD